MKIGIIIRFIIIIALTSCVFSTEAQDAPNISDFQNDMLLDLLPLQKTNDFLSELESATTHEQQTNKFYLKPVYSYVHSFQNKSSTKNYGGSLGANYTMGKLFGEKATNTFLDRISIQPDLGVQNGSTKSWTGSGIEDKLSITPSIQLGMSVYTSANRKQTLNVNGQIAYTYANDDNSPGTTNVTFDQASGWNEGVGLNYKLIPDPFWQITLAPAYSYMPTEKVNFPAGTTSHNHENDLSVKLGVEREITSMWTVIGQGTWFHDISSSMPIGRYKSRDWTDLGGGIRCSKNRLSIEADYYYEAFNAASFTHKLSVQINILF